MADFTLHTAETADAGAKEILEGAQKGLGFVPNLYAVMAEEPALLEAYKAVGELFAKTGLTPVEQNVVWLEINVQNNCHYCVPAHTGIAKGAKVPDEVIEALRNETEIADPKLEALRQFARKMTLQRGEVSDADLQAFFDAGYDRRAVLAVIVGLSHKVMSNYTNHVATTPVDAPFQNFLWERKS